MIIAAYFFKTALIKPPKTAGACLALQWEQA
jgi:hypothetical protein